ncbi:MAG TPA: hypothetical protein VFA20_02505 [Myxococcaceae bacterium]|nr:hypothetical protein [Myxococcaceae bacterium]
MNGVITSKDVLANMGLIWREFGPGCFVRCMKALVSGLVSGKPTTFLEVAVKPQHGAADHA